MKEIKCPKCGQHFTVDESDYASIVSQVRNSEFEEELRRRLEEMSKTKEEERKNAVLAAENDFQKRLGGKDAELGKKDEEIAALRAEIAGVAQSKQIEMNEQLSLKDQEIATLREQVKNAALTAQNEMSVKLSEKDGEISRLKSAVSNSENEKKVAVLEERNRSVELLSQKDKTIAGLQGDVKAAESDKALALTTMKNQYDFMLKQKEEEVRHYRDMKSKMSTKMVGETLEQHCEFKFNESRMLSFPNAYFEKDNDASGGSKGDFIFRDYMDGTEYVSIMFEMKNEMDDTEKKHKNEDFFSKLDKDRRAKGCEYAVLVSMLESESDYYNQGIVDVSYRYEKMFVIRPQFFMSLIAVLAQASKKSAEYRKEVELARQQSIDVTNFETKIGKFKDNFMKHATEAVSKHDKAIDEIDRIIKELEKMRDFLSGSNKSYKLALKDTDELTIKKLTRGNPTMKAAFDEARAAENEGKTAADDPGE